MVPELDAFVEYATLYTLSEHLRITQDQALQLPYDQAMNSLAYLHHTARAQHKANELQNRMDKSMR